MSSRISIVALLSATLIYATGCGTETTTPGIPGKSAAPTVSKEAHPLPDNAFKAQITLVDPPAKLRAGQKETIRVRIKNASDVQWYAHGGEINTNPDNRFYLAVGNRWPISLSFAVPIRPSGIIDSYRCRSASCVR